MWNYQRIRSTRKTDSIIWKNEGGKEEFLIKISEQRMMNRFAERKRMFNMTELKLLQRTWFLVFDYFSIFFSHIVIINFTLCGKPTHPMPPEKATVWAQLPAGKLLSSINFLSKKAFSTENVALSKAWIEHKFHF